MEIHRIKELLEKFYSGKTSLAEEEELHDYFSNSEYFPPELDAEKEYFKIIQSARRQEGLNPFMEEKLLGFVDIEESKHLRILRVRRIFRIAIAATFMLLIGLSVGLWYNKSRHKAKDTFTDPQIAYQEAQKTLLYISQKMNTGIEPLQQIKKINEGAEKLKPLGKLNEGLNNLRMVSLINNASNQKR